MRSSWRIGRLFGIEINVDPSWLIIFGLITWTLASAYFPGQHPDWPRSLHWIVGAITSLLFFASVLVHELAHSLVAIRYGNRVRSITLFIFGGVAQITEEPDRPLREFWMAFMGPLSSLAIAAVAAIVSWATQSISEPVAALTGYLAIINGMVAAFNLIPGFPLDGGRLLRALIWKVTGDLKRATRAASAMGQVVSFLFIAWGIFQVFHGLLLNGLWIIFIGWFLHHAAVSGYHQVVMRDLLRDLRAEDLMTTDFDTVSRALTLQELVDDHILRRREHAFLVADEERLAGIVCLDDVRRVPKEKWGDTRVETVMTPRDRLHRVSPHDDGTDVLAELNMKDVRQIPVIDGDRVVGILCRSDVLRALQVRMELGV